MGETACPFNVFRTARLHLCLAVSPLGGWIREKYTRVERRFLCCGEELERQSAAET